MSPLFLSVLPVLREYPDLECDIVGLRSHDRAACECGRRELQIFLRIVSQFGLRLYFHRPCILETFSLELRHTNHSTELRVVLGPRRPWSRTLLPWVGRLLSRGIY